MAEERRTAERRPVGLLVKLKHADVGSFVVEFAANLSPGGMFIRSRQPQPVGTPVKFEVQIANGLRVLRGMAVVRWVRQPDDPAGPPGMGVSFTELDATSKALVDRMMMVKAGVTSPELLGLDSIRLEQGAGSALTSAAGTVKTPVAPVAPLVAPVAPLVAPVAPVVAPVAPVVAPVVAPLTAPVNAPVAPRPQASVVARPAPAAPPAAPVVAPPSQRPITSFDIDVDDLVIDLSMPASPPGSAAPGPARTPAPVARPAQTPPPGARPAQVPPVVLTPVAMPAPAPEPPSAPGVVRTVFLTPPEHIEGTGPVIGIDLGTTNSCVAVMSNGRPVVLRSREGYNTIPSVASVSAQGRLLVSHRAKSQLVMRPAHTIYGAKRLVGRPYESAVVRQVRERFHYQVVPDASGKAAVRLGEHVLSLEEVQGLVLRECKEMAESHLGRKVERAVVTVPAYYSEPQREAVRKAGWMAGLKVERILNEPTSAALAYGLNRELTKRVLVYDLGGGTFDATVLRIDKNVFEVLGTGGDVFLGGLDFDNVLVDLLLERFQQKEGVPFQGDQVALSRVGDAAERAKVALSERTSYEVHIPMLMMDEAGRPRDLKVTLTRADMQAVCEPLVSRTLDVVRDVLLDAKLKPGEIDEIILVGGQSRMPLVREQLKELFGKPPHASVNADEAVALGAALYAGAVDKAAGVVLIDVLPMTIGVGLPGGGFTRVLERNTPLPAQRQFAIATTRDDEEALELSIFQGEDTHIAANEYLGTVRIDGLPKGPKGSVRVAVTLKLDAECMVHVTAVEYATRKEVRATLAARYSPEELRNQLGVNREAARAAEERRGEDLKARAGRFWGFLKKVVGKA
ncbi:MAG TPA: TIGR02266 family protein [Myxococcaceae bacterium]|nr:TIGR02266 family protein [Myxococcaceae bacterium]